MSRGTDSGVCAYACVCLCVHTRAHVLPCTLERTGTEVEKIVAWLDSQVYIGNEIA